MFNERKVTHAQDLKLKKRKTRESLKFVTDEKKYFKEKNVKHK